MEKIEEENCHGSAKWTVWEIKLLLDGERRAKSQLKLSSWLCVLYL